MSKRNFLWWLAATVFVSGCQTHLDVKEDGNGPYIKNATDNPRIGLEYGLPMLRFNLSLTRTLVSCRDDQDKPDIRFSTKVNAEPHYVVGERFVIDYESFSNWRKSTSLELQTYDNGMLKSINASAEDQTGAIIGDVVKASIAVVGLATGAPLAAMPLMGEGDGKVLPPPPRWDCSEQTKETLKRIASTKKGLEKETKKLDEARNDVTRWENLARLNALSEKDKEAWGQAETDMGKLIRDVANADRDLARLLRLVSVTEERVWPAAANSRAAAEESKLRFDLKPLPQNAKFLESLFIEVPADSPDAERLPEKLEKIFQISGQLVVLSESNALKAGNGQVVGNGQVADSELKAGNGQVVGNGQVADGELKANNGLGACKYSQTWKSKKCHRTGLYYRSPVPAELQICRVVSEAGCISNDDAPMVFRMNVMAPQLGQLRVLPLRNGTFQNNTLSATFREDGSLATFKYEDKAVRGKVASEAVVTGMNSVLAYKAAKRQAEVDELDDAIDRLEKQKKIILLSSELASSNQDTAVELARLNAQIALLEAKRKLSQLEAEGG